MDLKVMLRSNKGHKYILCITNEGTNYLITIPIYQSRSEEIGKALIENVITKYCVPKIKTVAPYNHRSLQAEHGIKSLSTILIKHLKNLGQIWPKYLPLAIFVYNTFNSPNLANYSPYGSVFCGKPKQLLNLETTPDIKVSGTFKDYYTLLNK